MDSFNFHGHQIAFRQSGQGQDVLLLHGFPTSSYDWQPIMELLKDRWRMLAPDMLGFGMSDKPNPHRYSIFEQADMLTAFAQAQNLTSLDLICHDYGCTVGLELMARLHEGELPFEIRKVILLNGSVYLDLAHLRPIQRILLYPVLGKLVARLFTRRVFGRQFNALLAHRLPESELDQHWALMTAKGGKAIYPALNRYLIERREFASSRWEPTLENLGRPLCLIWGLRDPVSVRAIAERIQERAQPAQVHLLEGVGHYPQLEVPQVVAEKVAGFLS